MLKFPKWLPAILLPLALYGRDSHADQPGTSTSTISASRVIAIPGIPTVHSGSQATQSPGSVAARMGGGGIMLQSGLDIDRYVVAGGGDRSTGGGFTLEGTIGQAVAGEALTASPFSLTSGFWYSDSSAPSSPRKKGGQLTSQ